MWCCKGPAPQGDDPKVDAAPPEDELELAMSMSMTMPALPVLVQNFDAEAATRRSTEGFWDTALNGVVASVNTGAIAVTSTFARVPELLSTGATKAGADLQEFFASLQSKPAPNVSQPAPGSGDSTVSEATTADGEGEDASVGVLGVDYQRYPLQGYVELPAILQPFVTNFVDHYLLVGRPSMAPSCGLRGYRSVVPKKSRAAAPFLLVIDKPGALKDWQDEKYIWVEFHLGDVFMLDVSGMKSMADYTKTLTAKQRWNFKDRQKKFNNCKQLHSEVVPLAPGDEAMVASLWPLYKQTGEKNGFTVLTREAFFDFHLRVKDLVVMLVTDVSDPVAPKLVSFCTGVRWEDVLMPMWCGTDYDNDLNRRCSVYFNMLYNYVAMAVADPAINTVDLGASMRTAKMAIGFKPVPSSGYFRCKNVVMQSLVESMMATYFHPEKLINDP